ncbi:DNA-directed RNA polymerase subunit E'' [candidate division MSBL1 archaeon SCGC-AAA382M17]|uniref:Transcription elongation factor Spt4 n=1 Tax=candidate division MSBL1 archaeon SCGC-AAA382M17 TaxID=1698284 RepID=A0ABR5TJL9_9EURY|nr:DNA-directed RNA polymerase subunit E'' [candidate division MSBL1 archaeon SCGC-AAA382M17]
MAEKACKNCHWIVDGKVCPVCNESSFSNDWRGYAIIIDPERSQIAERMKVDTPGRYALRVR